jgi:endogenous inhibitor of DNA gyrase (YacG/DUF329 family)
MIDLNSWHRGLHMITGAMALRFNRATPADLEKWAKALKAIAGEMEACGPRSSALASTQPSEKNCSAFATPG